MATRKDIRTMFYAELESAADGLVEPSNIGQNYPESSEELPAIAHNDAYRRIPMNTGAAATGYTESGGQVETYEYSVMMEAQFTVLILSDSDMEKENIYEAVRTHFEPYTLGMMDESDLHPDVYDVAVTDVNSQDDEDRHPVSRGDSMTINVSFQRFYSKDVDAISGIHQGVDSGTTDTGDGTIDITRNIN